MSEKRPRIAVIDFGMGNLFSIRNACEHAGLDAVLTHSRDEIAAADGLILPGVGAFGKAMATLQGLGLAEPIVSGIRSGKPFMGICLGLQLLMAESFEFGHHEGLGVIPGAVVRFDNGAGERYKVPHVGWSRIQRPSKGRGDWRGTTLDGLREGQFMYFVHSYYVRCDDPTVVLSMTTYGETPFVSSVEIDNIFACQFHPEKSAGEGLKIYENWARRHWRGKPLELIS